MSDDGEHKFRQGFYKFCEMRHSESLIKSGEVCLSLISAFRDDSIFGGKILDSKEGQVRLLHEGDSIGISIDNGYIYCAAAEFISDSLRWALEDKKECAVFIVDPGAFFDSMRDAVSDFAQHRAHGLCIYSGREVSSVEMPQLFNDLLEEPVRAAFVKPREYSDQLEFRVFFRNAAVGDVKKFKVVKVENPGRLIPVYYDGMGAVFSSGFSDWINATVFDRSGVPYAWFAVDYPKQVLGNVIFEHEGRECLAFTPKIPKVSGVKGTSKYLPLGIIDNRILLGTAPIDEIGSIVYGVGKEPPDNLRKRN